MTASSISRRELLLAAGGAALSPALAARDRAATNAPRRGGSIRVAGWTASNADTLDPARGGLSTDYVRHYMFYSGLAQYDRDLGAQPALAEAIDTSDYRTWRIRLRPGVVFHDGSPLAPADVVYSLMRHKRPETGSGVATLAAQFADVRATGPHEVTIRLIAPNVDLPVILCASHFLIIKAGTTRFASANGTGPFMCRHFEPGVRSVGVRNPNYWKQGRPYLDAIEFFGIADEPARVNALLSGDVHLIGGVSALSARRISASASHAVLSTASGSYTDLVLQQQSSIAGNADFGLAMKYLIDRELLNRTLFRNNAALANDHPIPPGNRYALRDLPQRKQDLDRARYHLRKSGIGDVRLPIYCSSAAPGSVDIASVLQEYGQRVGLNLAINRIPADGYWSSHWKKHPLTFGAINPRPTADIIFSLYLKSDSPQNESRWGDPRFDQMLVEARGSTDEARRRLLYGDMQEMVHRRGGLVIPNFLNFVDGFDRRLGGFGSIPSGALMGYSFADHVWWNA